jgi:L-ascorbate metabolism protein UlaG (beta-lactamase superfamily)
MTSAIHSSSLPDGSYGGNPGGFVVSADSMTFYYSGDTALTMDMKMIGEDESLRFAVLPIGDTFTMGVAGAIKAARWTGAREVVGVHYNTFPPIVIDTALAISAFESVGLRLHLPAIGDSVEFLPA